VTKKLCLISMMLFMTGCSVPACLDRRCLRSHDILKHEPGWMEIRHVTCGKDCSTVIPIYHPAYDHVVTVCDQWETDLERDTRRMQAKGLKPEQR